MRNACSLLALVLVSSIAAGCGDGATMGDPDTGADAARADAGSDAMIRPDTGTDARVADTGISSDADALGDANALGDAGSDASFDGGTDAGPCDGVCTASDATACPSDCPICVPGATQACYDGRAGTSGVGPCAGGLRTCAADGSGFGACVGEVVPMIEDCTTSRDDDCDGATPACATLIAATTSGGTGGVSVWDVAAANGRVAIVGDFSGTIDFGGMSLTSAGGSDAFVAVYDAHTLTWLKRFGDAATQQALAVALDAAGGVIVTGRFQGTIDPGGGPLTSAGVDDVFLVAYDHAGNFVHAARYGDANLQIAHGIAVDASGIVIVGETAGSVDFGGGPLTSAGGSDAFVAMFTPTGTHVASARYGTTGNQVASSVALDDGGNVYVAGTFATSIDLGGGVITTHGASDVFVGAFTRAAAWRWSRGAGGGAEDLGLGVAVSTDRVVLGGSFQQTVDFGGGPLSSAGTQDAFLAIYQLDGTPIASHRYGDAAIQSTLAVATDATNEAFLGGRVNGSIDFGLGSLAATGSDAFVASLDPASAARFAHVYGTTTAVTTALAVDGPTLVAVGNFMGALDLGAGPVTGTASGSFFVAYLAR